MEMQALSEPCYPAVADRIDTHNLKGTFFLGTSGAYQRVALYNGRDGFDDVRAFESAQKIFIVRKAHQ